MSLHMQAEHCPNQNVTIVLSKKYVWLLYTLLNNFGIIYLVEHSNFILITPHCSGCQHNEWKAYCADGHWPFKSMVLLSYIAEVLLMLMLILYQDVPTRISLLHATAATFCSIGIPPQTLRAAQQHDPVTSAISDHLLRSSEKPTDTKWRKQPLYRYVRLWPQLLLVDDIVCRRYSPAPDSEMITCPLLPQALQQDALYQAHNTPGSGHQGQDRTLQKLRLIAYWVGMSSDVAKHYLKCITCQQAKLPTPNKAPLVSLPVGRPWEMLAVDVLEVPLSSHGNRYLLVMQDYFTKWAEAFPMPDQTAKRITDILIILCARMGLPRIIHSDQG